MITWQLLALVLGTVLIRLLHSARRWLGGPNRYFSFSDFLDEERYIHTGGFLLVALPPLLGGAALALLPDVDSSIAAAAGFAAAFLGVWPVLQHPLQLLDEHLQHYWSKLRFLYLLFLGSSTALAYLGFVATKWFLPLGIGLVGTSAWRTFVDEFVANALYDVAKFVLLGLLSLAGFYALIERKKIGDAALQRSIESAPAEAGWESDPDVMTRRKREDGFEETP